MIDSTFKNANILIVDDQEPNIDVLEGLLDMQGYLNIKTTTDSREVLDLFKTFNPDLILLDLSMPYLTGFDVMEQLKPLVKKNTLLPILVLTADVTMSAKQRALSGGATDFITKPFDLIEVGLRIKNLLFTSFLQQQLQNQNQVLEEKVRERTLELENKNIDLNTAKEKAEASDRLKTSFINNISHEIRTPLNGILGFQQILAQPDITTEEREEYLGLLNESSQRLITTVSNFMEISLLTSGTQEEYVTGFSPIQVVNSVVSNFRRRCESKNLELSVLVPQDQTDLTINSDKDLLTKILNQLIDNALKFTQQGSVTIGYELISNELCFFVKDTGIGISNESQGTLFKNFMQEAVGNTRDYDGCGLGLAIAKGIVELLGGNIRVESEQGKGSTFTFSIPL